MKKIKKDLTPKQFKKRMQTLEDVAICKDREHLITLKLSTYGTLPQSEQTMSKMVSELDLQGIKVEVVKVELL